MSVGNNYDVIVVGGGAAGLMAAGVCAERGRRTAVFEKNEKLGRKLRITGKGRCNVTNNCTVQEVIACTPPGREVFIRRFVCLSSRGNHALF